MIRIFLSLMLLIPIIGNSQELKKYDGPFTNGMAKSGKAVFTYYIDQLSKEEVKHGDFRYDLRLSDESYRFSQAFRGSYERGLKTGDWVYRISKRDYYDRKAKLYKTGNVTLNASYRQGYPHGRWEYTSTSRSRSLKTVSGQKRWGKHTQSIKTKIVVNFVKGVLTDSFTVIIEPGKELHAYFDSQGFLQGTWTDHTAKEDHIVYYEHGVELSYSEIDLNMNKVIEQIEYIDNQKKLEQIRQAGSNRQALKQLPFTTDTTSDIFKKDSEVYQILTKYLFAENDFLYRYIPGDMGYYYDESGYRFLFGIKGAYRVSFLNQITPQQTKAYESIKSLENQISTFARRANKWQAKSQVAKSDLSIVSLLRNKSKLASTYLCIARSIYKGENLKAGLNQSITLCKSNQLVKGGMPEFISKQEYLDHIITELQSIKQESQPYYEQLKSRLN